MGLVVPSGRNRTSAFCDLEHTGMQWIVPALSIAVTHESRHRETVMVVTVVRALWVKTGAIHTLSQALP